MHISEKKKEQLLPYSRQLTAPLFYRSLRIMPYLVDKDYDSE